ncbi:MAG: methyltransferase [Candidatus Omnitrophica bacterium]|nr:methyltransferase [Candidatus Omnitrophota bacterium]
MVASFRQHIACKVVALAVCFTFIWQSLGPVADAQNAYADSLSSGSSIDISSIKVPPGLGEIMDSSKGSIGKTIIHIRDAHCDYSAQNSISGLIGYLRDNHGIRVVALEGGAGDYDLSVFTDIKDPKIRAKTADYFVRHGEINGAELYAINNPSSVMLYGVEDPKLYIENLNTYRDSLKFKDDALKTLKDLSGSISKLKSKIYPKNYKEFDEKVQLFKDDKMSFEEYAVAIADFAKKENIGLSEYPNISRFYEVMDHENGINMKEADRERNILIDLLNKNLSKKYLEELVAKTVAFNDDAIPAEEYYTYLMDKAKLCGIDLITMPNLVKLAQCAKKTISVNKKALEKEFKSLDSRMCSLFLKTEEERELCSLDKRLFILGRMFSATLVKDDWDYYSAHREEFDSSVIARSPAEGGTKSVPSVIARSEAIASPDLARCPAKGGTTKQSLFDLDTYRLDMEKFYDLSLKRDDVFLEKISSKLKKEKQNNIVLVTGGFHQENLKKLFTDKGYSYVEVLPRIEKADGENPYFGLLSDGMDPIMRAVTESRSNLQIASYLDKELGPIAHDVSNFQVAVAIVEKILSTGQPVYAKIKGKNIEFNLDTGVKELTGGIEGVKFEDLNKFVTTARASIVKAIPLQAAPTPAAPAASIHNVPPAAKPGIGGARKRLIDTDMGLTQLDKDRLGELAKKRSVSETPKEVLPGMTVDYRLIEYFPDDDIGMILSGKAEGAYNLSPPDSDTAYIFMEKGLADYGKALQHEELEIYWQSDLIHNSKPIPEGFTLHQSAHILAWAQQIILNNWTSVDDCPFIKNQIDSIKEVNNLFRLYREDRSGHDGLRRSLGQFTPEQCEVINTFESSIHNYVENKIGGEENAHLDLSNYKERQRKEGSLVDEAGVAIDPLSPKGIDPAIRDIIRKINLLDFVEATGGSCSGHTIAVTSMLRTYYSTMAEDESFPSVVRYIMYAMATALLPVILVVMVLLYSYHRMMSLISHGQEYEDNRIAFFSVEYKKISDEGIWEFDKALLEAKRNRIGVKSEPFPEDYGGLKYIYLMAVPKYSIAGAKEYRDFWEIVNGVVDKFLAKQADVRTAHPFAPAAPPVTGRAPAAPVGLCVTADTMLILRDGRQIPIVRIKAGDYVMSLNEDTRLIEPRRIIGLLDMGIKPVYKLTTESGRSIKTTANHPYLTRTGWVKVCNLKAGVEIAASRDEAKARYFLTRKSLSSSIRNFISGAGGESGVLLALNQFGGKVKSCLYVGLCEGGIAFDNLFGAFSGLEKLKDKVYHYPRSLKAWLPVADVRIGSNAILDLHIYAPLFKKLYHTWTEMSRPGIAWADEMPRGDILWDRVVSIELLGREQVYDIEVEGTHNFIGNNIFAHNTYIEHAAQPPQTPEQAVEKFKAIFGKDHISNVLQFITGTLDLKNIERYSSERIQSFNNREVDKHTLKLKDKGEVIFFTKQSKSGVLSEELKRTKRAYEQGIAPDVMDLGPMLIFKGAAGESFVINFNDLPQNEVRRIISALGLALGKLHESGHTHNDLVVKNSINITDKPQYVLNGQHIFWDGKEDAINFIDFGKTAFGYTAKPLDADEKRLEERRLVLEGLLLKLRNINLDDNEIKSLFNKGYDKGKEMAAATAATSPVTPSLRRSLTRDISAALPDHEQPEIEDLAKRIAEEGTSFISSYLIDEQKTQISKDVDVLIGDKIREAKENGTKKTFTVYGVGLGSNPFELLNFLQILYDKLKKNDEKNIGDWEINIFGIDATPYSLKQAEVTFDPFIAGLGVSRSPTLKLINMNIMDSEGLAAELKDAPNADYVFFRHVFYVNRDGIGKGWLLKKKKELLKDPAYALRAFIAMRNIFLLAKMGTRLVVENSKNMGSPVPVFLPPGCRVDPAPENRGSGLIYIDDPGAMPEKLTDFTDYLRRHKNLTGPAKPAVPPQAGQAPAAPSEGDALKIMGDEDTESVPENIRKAWLDAAGKVSVSEREIIDKKISAKFITDTEKAPMPIGMLAYHLYDENGVLVIINGRGMIEEEAKEAIYHEAAESYWESEFAKEEPGVPLNEMARRQAHRLAAAEEVLAFAKGGITPAHARMFSYIALDKIKLERLRDEFEKEVDGQPVREEHRALVGEYLGDKARQNFESYEKNINAEVGKLLEAWALCERYEDAKDPLTLPGLIRSIKNIEARPYLMDIASAILLILAGQDAVKLEKADRFNRAVLWLVSDKDALKERSLLERMKNENLTLMGKDTDNEAMRRILKQIFPHVDTLSKSLGKKVSVEVAAPEIPLAMIDQSEPMKPVWSIIMKADKDTVAVLYLSDDRQAGDKRFGGNALVVECLIIQNPDPKKLRMLSLSIYQNLRLLAEEAGYSKIAANVSLKDLNLGGFHLIDLYEWAGFNPVREDTAIVNRIRADIRESDKSNIKEIDEFVKNLKWVPNRLLTVECPIKQARGVETAPGVSPQAQPPMGGGSLEAVRNVVNTTKDAEDLAKWLIGYDRDIGLADLAIKEIVRILSVKNPGKLKRFIDYLKELAPPARWAEFDSWIKQAEKEVAAPPAAPPASAEGAEGFIVETIKLWDLWNQDNEAELIAETNRLLDNGDYFISRGDSDNMFKAIKAINDKFPSSNNAAVIDIIGRLSENLEQHVGYGQKGVLIVRFDEKSNKLYIAMMDKDEGFLMKEVYDNGVFTKSEDSKGKGAALQKVYYRAAEMGICTRGAWQAVKGGSLPQTLPGVSGLSGTLVFVSIDLAAQARTPAAPIAASAVKTTSLTSTVIEIGEPLNNALHAYTEGLVTIGMRVADMGCGTGGLAIRCAKKGARVDAIEIDNETLQAAKQNFGTLLEEDEVVLPREGHIRAVLTKNLFDAPEITDEGYDIVAFAPPLLNEKMPSIKGAKDKRIAQDANFDIIRRFMKESAKPGRLNPGGKIILVYGYEEEPDPERGNQFTLEAINKELGNVWDINIVEPDSGPYFAIYKLTLKSDILSSATPLTEVPPATLPAATSIAAVSYADKAATILDAAQKIKDIVASIFRNLFDGKPIRIYVLGATPTDEKGKQNIRLEYSSDVITERQAANQAINERSGIGSGNINISHTVGIGEAKKKIADIQKFSTGIPKERMYCAISASVLNELENDKELKNELGVGDGESVTDFLKEKAMLIIMQDYDEKKVYLTPYLEATVLGLAMINLYSEMQTNHDDVSSAGVKEAINVFSNAMNLASPDMSKKEIDEKLAEFKKDPNKFIKDNELFKITIPKAEPIDYDELKRNIDEMIEAWRSV